MRRNRLCDNCFGKGHVSRRCKHAPDCKAPNCKYKHYTTLLHFQPSNSKAPNSETIPSLDTKQSTSSNTKEWDSLSENGNAFDTCLTARVTQAIFMWIFPVKVHVNGKKTVIHAFYHSDSGVTLCTQRVINKLNLNG